MPRFFLEAKPFREDVYDREETRKAISKAYNRGVAWVGITNFERFVLYDAQEELTTAHPRPVLDIGCGDYVGARAEAGLHLLAPQAIQSRALEDYAQRIGARRRTVPVEKRLYLSMRDWREQLFNGMSRFLDWRSDEQLGEGDEAIQRLLDRLIFLRNCEDRGVGQPGLRALRNRILARQRPIFAVESLLQLFADAAKVYDSELFDTSAVIDVRLRSIGTNLDDLLEKIVLGLYSVPASYAEYDFSQMDADVLGQVYEQYLGHVAQRVREIAAQPPLPGMPSPRITVEAKRQRRKERGIYYTPAWVVRYIVEQTLGRFLQESADRPDAIESLAVLDLACGSGSFLIRAYETLLEYHAAQIDGDVSRLDVRTREGILRRNIYGVDLDPQAVEIARLNLLIRMVRRPELLPELKENVQHGNSLVEGNERELRPFFGDGWQSKHPFNWGQHFPKIMEGGGFDIIIGNPPYVGFHGFEEDKPYFREKYETAQGRFDLYIPFVERALQLLRDGGLVGFICPTNFMKREHGRKLRDLLRTRTSLLTIHDFQDLQAFEGPLNYAGIFVFRKSRPHSKHFLTYSCRELDGAARSLAQAKLGSGTWIFREPKSEKVVSRVFSGPVEPLGELTDAIAEGIVTGKNEVFLLKEDDVKEHEIEPQTIRRAIRGRQVKRYSLEWDGTYVLYPYQVVGGRTNVIPEETLNAHFPKTHAYLSKRRRTLGGRRYFDRSPKAWYELWCERDLEQHATLKIVTPELADSNKFALAPQEYFYLDTVCGITPNSKCGESIFYLLGLLNSSLIQYFYRQTTVPKANGFLIYKTMYLKEIPIRRIAFNDPSQADMHDRVVALVRQMIALHGRLASKGSAQDYEREGIESEIRALDNEIDDLVFDIYELSSADRARIDAEVRQQHHMKSRAKL